jgi:hypothetical protein
MVPSNWFQIVAFLVAVVYSSPVNFSNSSPSLSVPFHSPSDNSQLSDKRDSVVFRPQSGNPQVSFSDKRRHGLQIADSFRNNVAGRPVEETLQDQSQQESNRWGMRGEQTPRTTHRPTSSRSFDNSIPSFDSKFQTPRIRNSSPLQNRFPNNGRTSGVLAPNRKVGPEIQKKISELEQLRIKDDVGHQKYTPRDSRRSVREQRNESVKSREIQRDSFMGKVQEELSEEIPKGAKFNSPSKISTLHGEIRRNSIQNADLGRSRSNSPVFSSSSPVVAKRNPASGPAQDAPANNPASNPLEVIQGNTAISRGNSSVSPRLKSIFSCFKLGSAPPVFGTTLANSIDCVEGTKYPMVPTVLVRCIEFLTATGGYKEEGVYRVSGAKPKRDELVNKFKRQRGDVNLLNGSWGTPDVTGVLKQFLRELKDSIFTDSKVQDFHATQSILDESSRIQALTRLVNALPEYHRATLGAIFHHFQAVITYEENKMNACSTFVATGFNVWNRNFPLVVFETLANHANKIFPPSTKIV